MLAAVWKAAVLSRGAAYAKQFCLNQPGSKGKTPLMLACRNGCVCRHKLIGCLPASCFHTLCTGSRPLPGAVLGAPPHTQETYTSDG